MEPARRDETRLNAQARSRLNQFGGGFGAEADAIGSADPVVGIASQAQAGKGGYALVDLLNALLVADGVLRHGPAPAGDLGVLGIETDADHALTQNVDHLMPNDATRALSFSASRASLRMPPRNARMTALPGA